MNSGVLDHEGTSINSGHYVTEMKHTNEWLLCNDTSVSPIHFQDVVSIHNYILLFKKKESSSAPFIPYHSPPSFIPTHEWQEVLPGQGVPPGCHSKMFMDGSEKVYAKLLGDKNNDKSSFRPCVNNLKSTNINRKNSPDYIETLFSTPNEYKENENNIKNISNNEDCEQLCENNTTQSNNLSGMGNSQSYLRNPDLTHSKNNYKYLEETCKLCMDSTMHSCQLCNKSVCNFCTEPVDENEMKRKHKSGDIRCKTQQKIGENSEHLKKIKDTNNNFSKPSATQSNLISIDTSTFSSSQRGTTQKENKIISK